MPRATLALQVLPLNAPDALAAVDAAIAVIRDSGVSHEVGPMETTIEGDSLHASCSTLPSGRTGPPSTQTGGPVQTNIRMIESPAGIASMHDKTAPFREDGGG